MIKLSVTRTAAPRKARAAESPPKPPPTMITRLIEAWMLIRERSWGIGAGRLPFGNDIAEPISGDRVLSPVI